jgi:hypothetical protein
MNNRTDKHSKYEVLEGNESELKSCWSSLRDHVGTCRSEPRRLRVAFRVSTRSHDWLRQRGLTRERDSRGGFLVRRSILAKAEACLVLLFQILVFIDAQSESLGVRSRPALRSSQSEEGSYRFSSGTRSLPG